jgi:16S rRNA (cytidine1402-2'-O)-methyltransferase
MPLPPRRSLRCSQGRHNTSARAETVIFFESPERLAGTLSDAAGHFGADRRVVVARELSKLHEEYARGTLGALAARFGAQPPKGEITVLVAGVSGGPRPGSEQESS